MDKSAAIDSDLDSECLRSERAGSSVVRAGDS